MRYVAAYLLASMVAKPNPSAADIDKILSSVGIESENDKVEKIISELSGKDINEVIQTGHSKLASMPTGSAVAESTAGVPLAVEREETKQDLKKDVKKQESESEDDDMGFGLFD